jgi:hypothetical protein
MLPLPCTEAEHKYIFRGSTARLCLCLCVCFFLLISYFPAIFFWLGGRSPLFIVNLVFPSLFLHIVSRAVQCSAVQGRR